MPRPRRTSTLSTSSSAPSSSRAARGPDASQELASLYDYLLKIIVVGPSGAGKSSLLHRLTTPVSASVLAVGAPTVALTTPAGGTTSISSPPPLPYIPQTIGLDLRTHLLRLGTPPAPTTRLKLQLWDTAGTERFRSVARSYYRASSAALVLYDVASRASFAAAAAYVRDVRALAGEACVIVLVGNKADVDDPGLGRFRSVVAKGSLGAGSVGSSSVLVNDTEDEEEEEEQERQVSLETADAFATAHRIPLVVEVSARTGEGVEALFRKVAGMVLARVEMGQVDPGDPSSGVHYGDLGWGDEGGGGGGGGSVKSSSRGAGAGPTVRGWGGMLGEPQRRRRDGCSC